MSPDRVNSRNGYWRRESAPGPGRSSWRSEAAHAWYYPEWLLERRRRAGRALASVVVTSDLLGVFTRRLEKLAKSLG